MKTIMLVCNAGMSTSLLVNKMKAAAAEIDNETFDIFATPLSKTSRYNFSGSSG